MWAQPNDKCPVRGTHGIFDRREEDRHEDGIRDCSDVATHEEAEECLPLTEAGRGKGRVLPWSLRGGGWCGLADILILDVWPPELRE